MENTKLNDTLSRYLSLLAEIRAFVCCDASLSRAGSDELVLCADRLSRYIESEARRLAA
jgi:hypothetical protein